MKAASELTANILLDKNSCEEIIALNTHPLVRRQMPLSIDPFGEAECMEWVKGKEQQWEEHGYGPWAFQIDGKFAGWGGLQYEEGEAEKARAKKLNPGVLPGRPE